ncbi:MAG: hypothetical protein WC375_13145, partial [Methanomassiliicoccales archaeon]
MDDDTPEQIFSVSLNPMIVRIDLPLIIYCIIVGTAFSLISRYPPLIFFLTSITVFFIAGSIFHYMRSPIEVRIRLEGVNIKRRAGKS